MKDMEKHKAFDLKKEIEEVWAKIECSIISFTDFANTVEYFYNCGKEQGLRLGMTAQAKIDAGMPIDPTKPKNHDK